MTVSVADCSARTSRIKWARNAFIIFLLTLILLAAGTEIVFRYIILESRRSIIESPGIPDIEQIQSNTFSTWRLLPNLKNVALKKYIVDGETRELPREFVVSTNEYGYRGASLKPVGSRVRILTLGDSTTFGLCVNDSETWPFQLEKLLNEKAGFDLYEVVNAGTTGYTAYQALRRIDEWIALKPHVVVLSFGNNDRVCWDGISDIERHRLTAALEPEAHGLRLFAFLRLKLFFMARKADARPRLTSAEYLDCLEKMRSAFSKSGTRTICICWPQASQIETPEQSPLYYQEALRKYCEEHAVPLVNPIPLFREAGIPLFYDSVHTNPAGCVLIAKLVAHSILQLEISGLQEALAPSVPR